MFCGTKLRKQAIALKSDIIIEKFVGLKNAHILKQMGWVNHNLEFMILSTNWSINDIETLIRETDSTIVPSYRKYKTNLHPDIQSQLTKVSMGGAQNDDDDYVMTQENAEYFNKALASGGGKSPLVSKKRILKKNTKKEY